MYSAVLQLLLLVFSLSPEAPSAHSFKKLTLPQKLIGPEAFAFDAAGEGPYTSVTGGKILKYNCQEGAFVYYAHTSKHGNKSICTGLAGKELLPLCGRPAGIAFNLHTGELYIADAVLGLYVAPPHGGQSTLIASEVDGKAFKFLDGLDVDPTNGDVYFTSFSSVFGFSHALLAVAAKDCTGKLYKYDPLSKSVAVLLEGLSGSAGCAVSHDGAYVLVSEFIKNQVTRHWIRGPNAGKTEVFAKVPNPVNIKRTDSGDFWVACGSEKFFIKFSKPTALKLNCFGAIVTEIPLKKLYGETVVSELQEHNGVLYVGTLTTSFMGIIEV